MNAKDSTQLPSLYDPVPSLLGGHDSKPVAAAINNILPYPSGIHVPRDNVIHDGIRRKALLLDPQSQSKRNDLSKNKLNVSKKPTGQGSYGSGNFRAVRPHPKRGRLDRNKFLLSKDEHKYEIYEPLRKLWLDYAAQLYKTYPTAFSEHVTRMDLHGAPLTVTRARDPGLVGLSGTLVAETANTIIVVTRRDHAVTIPKNVSVVSVRFNDVTVEIFLPALAFRASERSARKIKKRHMPFI